MFHMGVYPISITFSGEKKKKFKKIGNMIFIATIQGRTEQSYLTWIGITIGKLQHIMYTTRQNYVYGVGGMESGYFDSRLLCLPVALECTLVRTLAQIDNQNPKIVETIARWRAILAFI